MSFQGIVRREKRCDGTALATRLEAEHVISIVCISLMIISATPAPGQWESNMCCEEQQENMGRRH